MADLILRNVDDAIVQALKERAGRNGLSTETEHLKIMKCALLLPAKKSFMNVLCSIPEAGKDSDFERV